MKSFLRNLRLILIFFILISLALLSGVILNARKASQVFLKNANEDRYALASRYANAGEIRSRDGVVLAQSVEGERRYAEDEELGMAFLHLVGDYSHILYDSVENLYQGELTGSKRPFYRQLYYDVQGKGLLGDDLILTVDSELTREAYRLLEGKKGSIVVQNYKTGEVLAMVSRPSVNPQTLLEWGEMEDTALFNRALNGQYMPASTFKVITSAAWLDSPAYQADLVVTCLRPEPLFGVNGVRESLNLAGTSHGEVNLERALATSCNYFYGQSAVQMGQAHLQATAERFGYNKALELGAFRPVQSVFEPKTQEQDRLSWMAIGQAQGDDRLLTTPFQLCLLASTVANDGVRMKAELVRQQIDPLGKSVQILTPQEEAVVLKKETAKRVQDLMHYAVEQEYEAFGWHSTLKVGAKTGTAEVEGQEENNRLMVGFVADEGYPYAFSVVLEGSDESAMYTAAKLVGYLERQRPGME